MWKINSLSEEMEDEKCQVERHYSYEWFKMIKFDAIIINFDSSLVGSISNQIMLLKLD